MRASAEWLCGLLDRCYGKALVLYPAEFREEFGQEMMQCFREDCLRTARHRGSGGLLLLSLRVLFDLAFSTPGVHMEILRQDLRFAWRMLRSSRGFTFTAIAALALGIGANSAIFSLVYGILLRPLPFPQPERLVMIWDRNPKGIERNNVSPPNFADFRARAASLSSVTAFYEANANLSGPGEPEHVSSYVVSREFFEVMGVSPALGAGFRRGDSAPEAVLSHALWMRRFHGDPDVVGRALRIDGRNYGIRGVMPADFRFPSPETTLWTTLPFDPEDFSRQAHFLAVAGRLKPGIDLPQARAELELVADGMARENPASNRGWGVTVVPLREQVVGEARSSLLLILGAVAFVLLIAWANIANLLLAQGAKREGELAVRKALGASAVRLGRQVITESMLLAVLGGAAGLLLGFTGVVWLKALRPANLPRLDEVTVNGWVVTFTFVLSLITGLACGLVPSWRSSRMDANAGLKQGGIHRRSFAGDRSRGFLILFEVALSTLLTLGAGLLVRTFLHLQNLDPGFNPAGVVSLKLDMPPARYSNTSQRAILIGEASARVRAVPGVEAAGCISNLPLTGGEGFNRFGFTIEGKDDPASTENHRFYGRWITPGYLRAMAVPLLRGRDFSEADGENTTPVAIIDSLLAKRYFPGEDPIGKFVRLSYARSVPRRIVGVAGEVRLLGLDVEPAPQIYIPVMQEARAVTMTLVLRSTLTPFAAARDARAALRRLDNSLPVYDVQPMTELVSDSIAARRFNTLLMGLFAALALLLSAVGIYGVLSGMVGERLHEIGVRMALGADRPKILLLIVRQGMKQALAGTVLGLGAAMLLTRLLSGLLYGVSRLDAWAFTAAALIMLGASLLACLVPALTAARADPVRALRN